MFAGYVGLSAGTIILFTVVPLPAILLDTGLRPEQLTFLSKTRRRNEPRAFEPASVGGWGKLLRRDPT